MACERIPAAALYIAHNAAPNLADAVTKSVQSPDRRFPPSIIDDAFASARKSLSLQRLLTIIGRIGDDWTREAFVAAINLSNEALLSALRDRAIWDRRRTAKTRRDLLYNLVHNNI
jgi:hypothetical protein